MIKRLDYINIGLILFSAILAMALPFRLFLLSYAVLGPLHYLTEICWLHKRAYFTESKNQWKWLWIFSLLMGFSVAFRYSFYWDVSKEFMNGLLNIENELIRTVLKIFDNLLYPSLVVALSFVLTKKVWNRILILLTGGFVFFVIKDMPLYQSLMLIMIPTIIHVALFTWVFMINGAIKNKSKPGYVSVTVWLIVFVGLLSYNFWNLFDINESTLYSKIESTGFSNLNIELINLLSIDSINIYSSDLGKRIQSLIAFCYTYHYLNWFGKTEVIKWHKVKSSLLVATVLIWLCSIGVYYYDYVLGFVILYMLSIAHVLLEFPLNIRSFVELKKNILEKKVPHL